MLATLKTFWQRLYFPFRKWAIVKAVGREMDKRLSKRAVELDRIAVMRQSVLQSQMQYHIDRLADENANLKRLLGKAVNLGFDPDTVPDSELLSLTPRSGRDR